MANRGRSVLIAAVRNMSHAAVSLDDGRSHAGPRRRKEGPAQLQEAFARSRFLMRALSQREQLDLTRRQTGKLDSTARVIAPVPDGERNAPRDAWRAVLADVLVAGAAPTRAQLTSLAERVLQIDPASARAQHIATALMSAGAALASPRTAPVARAALDSAAIAITSVLRERCGPAHPPRCPPTRAGCRRRSMPRATRHGAVHRRPPDDRQRIYRDTRTRDHAVQSRPCAGDRRRGHRRSRHHLRTPHSTAAVRRHARFGA